MLKKKQSPSQAEEAKAGHLKLQAKVLRMKVSADVTIIQKSEGIDEIMRTRPTMIWSAGIIDEQ